MTLVPNRNGSVLHGLFELNGQCHVVRQFVVGKSERVQRQIVLVIEREVLVLESVVGGGLCGEFACAKQTTSAEPHSSSHA